MFKNFIYVLIIGILLYILFKILFVDINTGAVLKAEMNYGSEAKEICRQENVPYNYIMSLIILECSGRKPAQSRFEPAVYDKLKQLRNGSLSKYSTISAAQVRGLSDETLKLLATSWGALQIMGYHCYDLGVPVDALYNSNTSLKLGIRWCKKNYGKYLIEEDFANAFHCHNTGKPMPFFGLVSTHDPQYVFKGIRYMSSF
jgi:hypothetical protein